VSCGQAHSSARELVAQGNEGKLVAETLQISRSSLYYQRREPGRDGDRRLQVLDLCFGCEHQRMPVVILFAGRGEDLRVVKIATVTPSSTRTMPTNNKCFGLQFSGEARPLSRSSLIANPQIKSRTARWFTEAPNAVRLSPRPQGSRRCPCGRWANKRKRKEYDPILANCPLS
jgi:hypothetical protein